MVKGFSKQGILFIATVLVLSIVLLGCQSSDADQASVELEGQARLISENIEEWFAGEELHNYVANDRDYDWFIDQGDTGQYSNSNCGPSSTVMAMKWLDEDYKETAEEAREEHLLSGGWWYTSTITQYFDNREVDYSFMKLDQDGKGIEDLKNVIDEEQIAILCVSMDYITRETDSNLRINRFYDYDDGHFLIMKGYVEIDDKLYFEVYDPNNWGMTYEDGSPKGLDRYYLADELFDAAYNWYEFAIVLG